MTILTKEHEERGGLTKVAIRLWKDDLAYLREFFPDNYNAQLRRIVAYWVREHRRNNAEEY